MTNWWQLLPGRAASPPPRAQVQQNVCAMRSERMLLWLIAAAVGAAAVTSSGANAAEKPSTFTRTIRMPGAVSDKEDDLVCHSMQLDTSDYQYILKYEPHATKKIAHHMMLYGCPTPASADAIWKCGGSERGELSVCGRNAESDEYPAEPGILYAWALDAPPTEFPKGVGLRVSGDTNIQYIIVQLHYSRKFEAGEKDDKSGVTLHMTYDKLSLQAGFYILGVWGFIPPKTKDFLMESACVYGDDVEMYPIRYRTHSHHLADVTSGYRVRNGSWTEIGRMSPRAPQTFYPVTNPGIVVRKGDVLASRCTMTNDREETTVIGSRNRDEMCNFYIMYYTRKRENLADRYCFTDAQTFHWSTYLSSPPADASSLRGVKFASGHDVHGLR